MRLKEVKARVIQNSRGEETIEVIVNKNYRASAPSGASIGKYEVPAFPSQGVRYAVTFLNKYPNFKGFSLEEFDDLKVFDNLLSVLGGNTVVALQLACLKALSENNIYSFLNPKAKKLPIPLGNCVGGGAHTKVLSTDIQEFLLVPEAKTMLERVKVNAHIHAQLRKQLHIKTFTDEGALILKNTNEETLVFLTGFLENKKNTLGYTVRLGLDLAASQLYRNKQYHYRNFSSAVKKKVLSREEQITLVNKWIKEYSLAYVEDPLEQEDFSGFTRIYTKKTLVCGDDLIATNIERFREAVRKRAINSVIIKPNQIGSLVKAKQLIDFAKKKGVATVISHRSGETMDTSIAHLAVAWNIQYIKTGIYGKEREVKLRELVSLEKKILF